jgi:small subunit ribosomal protein S20
MAHSKHRKKTLRQAEAQRLINRGERSKMRTAVKQARTAVETDPANADAALVAASKKLDKAGAKNLIHPNKANRMKSRLAKARNRAAAGS